MGYDYGPLKATADRLLEDFGVACVVQTYIKLPDDQVTGEPGGSSPVNTPAVCVLTQINERNAPGVTIEDGDQLAIVSIEVPLNSILQVDGHDWRVLDVFDVKPGATFMISKARVHK